MFDEIPSRTLQDIKETVGCSDGTDNVKTVYPPTNTVCGWGYKMKNRERSKCEYRDISIKMQGQVTISLTR